jgi:ABC-2 type transport system ATP-binding protein
MPDAVLEITDIRKRFGALVALDRVSLSVERGEVFGLLGPNGAGKTTLLSIAAGLAPADSGTVALFGKPFTRDSRELRNLVGIGTQDLSIYPDLTARENLRFFGKLYGLRGRELESRVGAMLDAVGLTDRANVRAGTFSGGMKRRLNLAVAVVHGPKLLILDEPTTGVDPQSRNHIFEQVRALNAAGLTVIYTSHYMEEVQALCPRLAILDNGQLRACDTLPNLLKRLDTTVRVTVAGAPGGFADRLRALPGVTRVSGEPLAPSSQQVEEDASPVPAAGPPMFSPALLRGGIAGQHQVGFPLTATEEAGALATSAFELHADDTGPVLAKVAQACAATGAELVSASTTEPSLERVFLHLTGRGLRD